MYHITVLLHGNGQENLTLLSWLKKHTGVIRTWVSADITCDIACDSRALSHLFFLFQNDCAEFDVTVHCHRLQYSKPSILPGHEHNLPLPCRR